MTDLGSLRSHLERVAETIATFGEAQTFGERLTRDGLLNVRDDLTRQMDDARRARLDVLIEGAPVVGHEIRVDALTTFLHSFQEAISSIAQALIGKATSRSAIPGPLREITSLRLAALFPGSVGVTLRGPLDEDVLDVLPGTEIQVTVLDDAVEVVLNIIELAGGTEANDDPIIEAVLPLGTRTFKHLSGLSSGLVADDMSARIEWTRPQRERRAVTFGRPAARRLEDVLGRNKMTDRETVIEGRLGTVSDIRNRVELETATGKIIPAKVIEELVPQLGQFFTHRVSATFQVTTVRSLVTGQEKNAYTLVGLAMLPGEQPALDDNEAR